MQHSLKLLLCLGFLLCAALPLHAGKLAFGSEEEIKDIAPIEGTEYILAYKVTYHMFLAGMWVSDDGYVLHKKGDRKRYAPLTPEIKAEMLSAQLLPDPLPRYRLTFWQYVWGYLLWIIIVGVTISGWIGHKLKAKQAEPKPAQPQPAS